MKNLSPLLELHGVERVFIGKQGANVRALEEISLEFHAGEFVCITGPSGAGKTTLMNILGCLDQPTNGTYRVLGRNTSELGSDALALLRRRLFGFVFQSFNLLEGTTVLNNVAVPASYAGISRSARTRRALKRLSDVGLEHRARSLPRELSGGEQQRVALARALTNGGHVILADEPTGSLDKENSDQVLQALEDLAALGHTIIMISHNSDIAARARRRIEMLEGRIVSDSGYSRDGERLLEFNDEGLETGRSIRNPFGAALDIARTALLSAALHKGRTILLACCIGIAVSLGIAAPSVNEGMYRHVFDRVNLMGLDAMTVFHKNSAETGAPLWLTEADANAIARDVPNVRMVSPEVFHHGVTVRRGDMIAEMTVSGFVDGGTKQERGRVSGYRLQAGDFISQRDDDSFEKVAVLGSTAFQRLFPDGRNAIGETILIKNVPFRIKGVFEHRGGVLAGNHTEQERLVAEDGANNWVYVPYKTATSLLFQSNQSRSIRWLNVFVHDPSQMRETVSAIRDVGIRRRGEEAYAFEYPQEFIQQIEPLRRRIMSILGTIASIALLAGNASIVAIMLMSVRARQREIGIRMAVGARRKDVLRQFLSEAIAISALGSLVGILLCSGLLALLGRFEVPSVFSAWYFALPCLIALAVGAIAGLIPAVRAAGVSPVEALALE